MRTTLAVMLLSSFVLSPALAAGECRNKTPLSERIKCVEKKVDTLNARLDEFNTVNIKSEKTNECIYAAADHGVSMQKCNENPQGQNNWNFVKVK